MQRQLIATKKNLLAYDDTTFYSKLVSGEATLVHAWDGWCNYGIAENAKIKYVIPKEGSDLWVDTMVIPKAREEPGRGAQVHRLHSQGRVHGKWVVENIMYKVPNKAAWTRSTRRCSTTYPNMAIPPADLAEI